MTLKGFLKTQLWVHPYGEVDLEREGGREEGGGRYSVCRAAEFEYQPSPSLA